MTGDLFDQIAAHLRGPAATTDSDLIAVALPDVLALLDGVYRSCSQDQRRRIDAIVSAHLDGLKWEVAP